MFKRLFVMILFLTVGFVGGLVVTGRLQSAQESSAAGVTGVPDKGAAVPAAVVTPADEQAAAAVAGAGPDFTAVAARTMGAVVNISSTQAVRQPNSPFGNDPFFQRFFGGDDGYTWRKGMSAGSGVIISADGYVLTNNHVVGEHMQQVTVILSDKRERPAKLVGIDPMTDLALLKINDKDLPSIPWGDSSHLKVAEWVLAIGNPYQLGQTVTLGIVSGINRNYSNISAIVDYIQTDAAINPGNSGGALINRRGELVGINTWIYSESGGYQGIGFAVPANVARRVADELIKTGEVTRGTIGFIETTQLTPQLARDIGVSMETKGAVVLRMRRNAPAFQAGLRPGDVIQAVNGQAIDEQGQFERMLLAAPIGSVLQLKIIREGKNLELRIPVIKDTVRARDAA